jgi:hypothetical protein
MVRIPWARRVSKCAGVLGFEPTKIPGETSAMVRGPDVLAHPAESVATASVAASVIPALFGFTKDSSFGCLPRSKPA